MWKYESDGGRTGNLWAPKTHYVTDGYEERFDCDTPCQARRLAKTLNEEAARGIETTLHSLRKKDPPPAY